MKKVHLLVLCSHCYPWPISESQTQNPPNSSSAGDLRPCIHMPKMPGKVCLVPLRNTQQLLRSQPWIQPQCVGKRWGTSFWDSEICSLVILQLFQHPFSRNMANRLSMNILKHHHPKIQYQMWHHMNHIHPIFHSVPNSPRSVSFLGWPKNTSRWSASWSLWVRRSPMRWTLFEKLLWIWRLSLMLLWWTSLRGGLKGADVHRYSGSDNKAKTRVRRKVWSSKIWLI